MADRDNLPLEPRTRSQHRTRNSDRGDGHNTVQQSSQPVLHLTMDVGTTLVRGQDRRQITGYGKSHKKRGNKGSRKECFKSQGQTVVGVTLPLPSSSSSCHQLTDDEKQNRLKEFDLDSSFGPCRDITRQQRLERGLRFNLKLPSEVKSILEEDAQKFQLCIWDQHFRH